MAFKQLYATGRRKTSVARVFLRPGRGEILVNGSPVDNYFGRKTDRMILRQPLESVRRLTDFDCYITVAGGGTSGQAGAIRHGIARVLVRYEDEEQGGEGGDSGAGLTLRQTLRQAGFLTRDARMVERKKVGRHKARKGTQYSKR